MSPLNDTSSTEAGEIFGLEQFRRLVDSIPHMVWSARPDGSMDYCNCRFLDYIGATLDQMRGWGWSQMLHPDDRQRVVEAWRQSCRDGTEYRVEARLRHGGTGDYRWFLAHALPQRDAAGDILCWFGTLTEIDDRKRAEEELRRSEERQRFALESAGAAAWAWDMRTGKVTWSDNAETAFGLPKGSLGETYETTFQAVHPEDRERLRTAVERAVKGEAEYALEFRAIRANGEVMWVYERGQVMRDQDGQPVRMTGVFLDITERKRAEEALRADESRKRAIVQAVPDLMFQVDRDGVFKDYLVSDPTHLLLPPSQFMGKRMDEVLPEPIGRTAISLVRRALETSQPQFHEYSIAIKGETRHYEARLVPGESDGVLIVVRDNTDRKRAEDALRKSERSMARAQRIARMGNWEWDLVTNEVRWSDEIYRIFGLEPREFGASYQAFLERVHPEDRQLIFDAVDATLREGAPYSVDHRIILPDGTIKTVNEQAEVVYNADGKQVLFLGTVLDVTERRRSEDALRESEHRYRQLVELSPNVVFIQCEGKFAFVNPAGVRLFGAASDEELVGKPVMDFMHSKDREVVRQRIAQLREGKPVPPLEEQYLRVDGTPIDVEVAASPFTYGGKPAALVVARDISQHKAAEAALRQSERQAHEAAESNRRLLQELDHRVRNNLTGLLGLIELMRQRARTVDDFAEAVTARLTAMAHVHQLLSHRSEHPIALRGLVESLLETLEGTAPISIPVALSGPAVLVDDTQARSLTLILIELYSNSCKYGAHRSPGGRLAVEWTTEILHSVPFIRLFWKESCGEPISGPVEESLGMQLVRSFVTRELKGQCWLRFGPEGADHEIRFPATMLSALEGDGP